MWDARATALIIVGFVSPASAQAPAALVESVNSKSANVELMDYVNPGQVIKLGIQDSIVLGYLKSCVRESINGGVVIVGSDQSDVALGQVLRTKVPCDSGQMQLTPQQSKQSAGIVLRNVPVSQQKKSEPQVTIFGVFPIFEIKGPGELVVERVDRKGEVFRKSIPGQQKHSADRFHDAAKPGGFALSPGGTYVAKFGERSIAFKVDSSASAGVSPAIGRLLRFDVGN